jgi:hypothetical protein
LRCDRLSIGQTKKKPGTKPGLLHWSRSTDQYLAMTGVAGAPNL